MRKLKPGDYVEIMEGPKDFRQFDNWIEVIGKRYVLTVEDCKEDTFLPENNKWKVNVPYENLRVIEKAESASLASVIYEIVRELRK